MWSGEKGKPVYAGWKRRCCLKRRCWAYEVIVYIERRYLVMIVRWMGNHASTCGVIGVTRDDDPIHDLLY